MEKGSRVVAKEKKYAIIITERKNLSKNIFLKKIHNIL